MDEMSDGALDAMGSRDAKAAPSSVAAPDFGAIKRHPQAKLIAKGWQESSLATQSLSPGMALTRAMIFEDGTKCDEMCSRAAGAWLSKSYGPGTKVDGKSGNATCRAFEFEGRSILAFSEGELGTRWQVLLGDAEERGGGRAYGRAVLLACDKECVEYWARFCACMSAQMAMDPSRAKAIREAADLDAGLPSAAPGLRRPGI